MTFHSRLAIQDVPGARRRSDGETEAEADSHNLHLGSAEGARESFSGIFLHIRWHVWFWSMDNNLHLIPGDSLPWHLHPWRDCHEDRPHRSPSAGEDKWLLETYCPRPAIHCISTLYRNWQSCVGGALAADFCIGCHNWWRLGCLGGKSSCLNNFMISHPNLVWIFPQPIQSSLTFQMHEISF